MEFEFDVIKEFDVEDAKPAFITILDYYENGTHLLQIHSFFLSPFNPRPKISQFAAHLLKKEQSQCLRNALVKFQFLAGIFLNYNTHQLFLLKI